LPESGLWREEATTDTGMKELRRQASYKRGMASAAQIRTGDRIARAKILQLPGRVTIGVQHMRG